MKNFVTLKYISDQPGNVPKTEVFCDVNDFRYLSREKNNRCSELHYVHRTSIISLFCTGYTETESRIFYLNAVFCSNSARQRPFISLEMRMSMYKSGLNLKLFTTVMTTVFMQNYFLP